MPHSFHRCQFEHGELKSVAKKKKLFYELHRHANLQRGTQRRSTQTSISSPISLSPTLRPPATKARTVAYALQNIPGQCGILDT